MTRIALLLAAAAAAVLALAGAASAKEVVSVQVCGPDACSTVTDRETITRFEESAGSVDVYTGPAAPAEYYLVRVAVDSGDNGIVTLESFYVPSARVLRGPDERGHAVWWRAPRAERTVLDSVATGVRPFPVPEVTRATVGQRPAADPASYLNLYRLKRTPSAHPKRSGWRRIRLTSALASPWTDGANVLMYLPRERLLQRDGEYVRLSKRLGRAVQRAAALR
jgi:hypothetical protein